jgi:hypothetical protein
VGTDSAPDSLWKDRYGDGVEKKIDENRKPIVPAASGNLDDGSPVGLISLLDRKQCIGVRDRLVGDRFSSFVIFASGESGGR